MRDSSRLPFSADMYYLIGFQKLRKNAADSLIDRDGPRLPPMIGELLGDQQKDGRTGVRQTIPRAEALHGSGNRSEPPYLPEDI